MSCYQCVIRLSNLTDHFRAKKAAVRSRKFILERFSSYDQKPPELLSLHAAPQPDSDASE